MKLLHIGLCATGQPYNGLQRAMIRQFDEYREINSGVPNLSDAVEMMLAEYTPDVCFIQLQREGVLSAATARMLQSKCFTINWTGDIRVPTPQWFYEIGKLIDLTVFTNMNDVENLRAEGIASDYLDIGIDETIYTPRGEKMPKIPEIVFMANNYNDKFQMSRYRQELVSFMQSKFGDRFGVYGNGWKKGNGSLMGNQQKEAAAYRSAKIGINCSHIEAKRYSSDRILRLMASGAMCLTKGYPEIEKDYTDGEHLIVWNTFEELEALCRHYLEADAERERISAKGSEFIRTTKTFDHMVAGIKTLYEKHRKV